MRVALLLAVAVGCSDGSDPCADSTGHCVALRVESSITFDELELGITIGATQSIVVRPTADIAAPFLVPIEVGPEPAELDVVAVGRAGTPAVVSGAVTVQAPETAPILRLAAPEPCIDGGYYCGGDRIDGDPGILYTCRSNRVPALRERCAQGCVVAPPGTDDYCADSVR